MAEKSFSTSEALRFGWQIFKENAVFLILIYLIIFFNGVIFELIRKILGNSQAIMSFTSILQWGLSLVLGMGLIRIGLQFVDGKKGSYSDLIKDYRLFFKYLAGSIVYGLIVLGGLLLLIVPGIIWAIKFQFWSYLLIDKGMGPIEAIKKSGELTRGVKWGLLKFLLVIFLVTLVGLLALVVGLFVAIPVTCIAMVYVYRQLLKQAEPAVETSAPAPVPAPTPAS